MTQHNRKRKSKMKWHDEDKLIFLGWILVCSGFCGLLFVGFFN